MFTLSNHQFNLQYSLQLKGGLSTSDMNDAQGRSLEELKSWLEALLECAGRGTRLSVIDSELITDSYFRIDNALKQEHGISMPYAVMQRTLTEKMAWYISHIKCLTQQTGVAS